jgi:hypothetical protein
VTRVVQFIPPPLPLEALLELAELLLELAELLLLVTDTLLLVAVTALLLATLAVEAPPLPVVIAPPLPPAPPVAAAELEAELEPPALLLVSMHLPWRATCPAPQANLAEGASSPHAAKSAVPARKPSETIRLVGMRFLERPRRAPCCDPSRAPGRLLGE